ncbi:MAG: hypothetical protein AAFU60_06915 [Bacteroidota bacterium]
MKRIQLFEFEDFNWFPKMWRTSMTSLIVVLHKLMGTPAVLAELLKKARQQVEFSQVVDLGSGSGGAMPLVFDQLSDEQSSQPFELLLTDLYPNPQLVRSINDRQTPGLRYKSESVDATNMGETPTGLKTMVNSFHHMPPPVARKILHTAQENRQPFLIYEIAENNIPTLVWWLFLPVGLVIVFVMALFLTPFSRPLTVPQLVFTYLIPVIPLAYAWDGQASLVRMYTFDDLKSMLPPALEDYEWEMAPAPNPKGKTLGYYVLGIPKG